MKCPAVLFLLVLSLAPLSAPARTPAPAEIHYSFDVHDPGVVHVTLELPLAARTTEVLMLPSSSAGQTDLFRAVRNLRASGPGTQLTPTDSPARWLLVNANAGTAQVTYDLLQDRSGPLRPPLEHRVILTPGLWIFNGENALVLPRHAGDAPVHATFDFTGLQTVTETVAEPFANGVDGSAPRPVLLTSFGEGPRQDYRGTWSGVRNAFFAGGSLVVEHLQVDGEAVTLASVPALAATARALSPPLQKIIAAEQRLAHEAPGEHPPRLSVLLAAYDEAREGGNGSAYTGAAVVFVPRDALPDEDLLALLAHETLHQWLPGRMGFVADTRELAWFAEGFTRFYETVLLREAGLLSEAATLQRVNLLLRTYAASPRLTTANPDLLRATPVDPFSFQQPYLRGAVLALWLDTTLRQQSGGRSNLSDLLRTLRATHAQPLTADRIFATAARVLDPASVVAMRRFALDGTPIPVLPDSLGPCVAFASEPAWTYALGFDAASLERNGRLRGVEQGSSAYAAGARDGLLLDGWSVWSGDPQRAVRLEVEDATGTRSRLSFLPHGREITVEQASLRPGCVGGLRLPH